MEFKVVLSGIPVGEQKFGAVFRSQGHGLGDERRGCRLVEWWWRIGSVHDRHPTDLLRKSTRLPAVTARTWIEARKCA
jgi:hypothetical protein